MTYAMLLQILVEAEYRVNDKTLPVAIRHAHRRPLISVMGGFATKVSRVVTLNG